jgi:L-seryl-tRNA(Ser) seleniumtransferase
MPISEIEKRAMNWAKTLGSVAEVVDGETMVGGGSLPGDTLPTRVVSVRAKDKTRLIGHKVAQNLRKCNPPVIGRVSDDVLFLDPRSVLPEDDFAVIDALTDSIAAMG